MQLLEYYRNRFGQAVKRQGNGWNGPCPLCGGIPGKSDRFMVWPDRSESLGDVCAKNGIRGIWSCRQCNSSGDTIAYLMKIDGMTFKEALGELGIECAKLPRRRRSAPAEPASQVLNAWMPKTQGEPSPEWQQHALKLIEEAEKKIWEYPAAIRWLNARGLSDGAIRQYRLGYLDEESEKYHGRFRPRKAFGLPVKKGQDGKIHDKLYIPRGILIPSFSNVGALLNLRIRRLKVDIKENHPKYMELEGSCHGPLFLQSSLANPLAVYFITEAEMDAMLIHFMSAGVIGAVAVRTNRGKPDDSCHGYLESASRICVALDYDTAGAEGCGFWEENYSNSIRWPVPEGKDPGDAFALGVDIRQWLAEALPPSVKLPEKKSTIHRSSIPHTNREIQVIDKNGSLEACASGQKNLGKGVNPNFEDKKGNWPSDARARLEARAMADDWRTEPRRWEHTQPEPYAWASQKDFTPNELDFLNSALPSAMTLGSVFLDVAVIWLLWRDMPVAFIHLKDKEGRRIGFRWDCNPDWRIRNEDKYNLFWRYQYTSRALWNWLSDHPADRITSRNLLNIWLPI